MHNPKLALGLCVALSAGCQERTPHVSPPGVEAGIGSASVAPAAAAAPAEAESARGQASEEMRHATVEQRIVLSQRVERADRQLSEWEGRVARLRGEAKAAAERSQAQAKRHSAAAKALIARLEIAAPAALPESRRGAEQEVRELDRCLRQLAAALEFEAD